MSLWKNKNETLENILFYYLLVKANQSTIKTLMHFFFFKWKATKFAQVHVILNSSQFTNNKSWPKVLYNTDVVVSTEYKYKVKVTNEKDKSATQVVNQIRHINHDKNEEIGSSTN